MLLESTKEKINDLTQSNTDFIYELGEVTRKHTQNISQQFLDDLKDARNESTKKAMGEFHRVASIPTVIVEKWMREGFNIMTDRNITGADIVKRLKAENLDAFLTTEKSI